MLARHTDGFLAKQRGPSVRLDLPPNREPNIGDLLVEEDVDQRSLLPHLLGIEVPGTVARLKSRAVAAAPSRSLLRYDDASVAWDREDPSGGSHRPSSAVSGSDSDEMITD